jgi:hypothetical protein
MERLNKARGKAVFTLKDCLQHAQASYPASAIPISDEHEAQDVEEYEEWFEVDGEGVHLFNAPISSIGVVDHVNNTEAPCPSKKSETGNTKIKAQFGWRRTHNEQTLVHPCGIIYARATMFGAKAVLNFLVMVKNAFSVPGAQKPEHLCMIATVM